MQREKDPTTGLTLGKQWEHLNRKTETQGYFRPGTDLFSPNAFNKANDERCDVFDVRTIAHHLGRGYSRTRIMLKTGDPRLSFIHYDGLLAASCVSSLQHWGATEGLEARARSLANLKQYASSDEADEIQFLGERRSRPPRRR